jgi:hypothetical protein
LYENKYPLAVTENLKWRPQRDANSSDQILCWIKMAL